MIVSFDINITGQNGDFKSIAYKRKAGNIKSVLKYIIISLIIVLIVGMIVFVVYNYYCARNSITSENK